MDCIVDDPSTSRCSCCDSLTSPEVLGGFPEISVCELRDAVATSESSLVRLKAILSYFSQREDCCVYKCVEGLPVSIKDYIYSEFKRAGRQSLQYFFEYLMTTMAETISRGFYVLGFKLLIHLLASKYPEATECSLAQMAVLRNCFEDDEAVCMKILWGFAQAGYSDLNTGIRVWSNLMTPLIGVPQYSPFICRYISRIINDVSLKCLNLSHKDFQVAIEALVQPYPIADRLRCMLEVTVQRLAKRHIEVCDNLPLAFAVLLSNTSERTNFAEAVVDAIYLDPRNTLPLWEVIAKENHQQTGIVLSYIDQHWDNLTICLRRIPAFLEFLHKMQCNSSPVDHLADSILRKIIIENLDKAPKKANVASGKKQASSSASKGGCTSSGGCRAACTLCKWMLGSFLLVLAIAGAINYDVHTHGGVFEKSATGKFLKDTGMLPYAQTVYFSSMSNGARGYQFMEENVPVYSQKTGSVLKPYWEFTKDLAVVAGNGVKQGFKKVVSFADEKSPVVVDFIEKYAPGLPAKIKANSVKAWVYISNTSYDLFSASKGFVNEKVLVGKFSPENLNQMLNETQVHLAEYYKWFKVRVDDYAKL